MNTRHHQRLTSSSIPYPVAAYRAHDPGSDAPPPAPVEVPPPAVAGGLENIPEELLPEPERVREELDHAGLDVILPGEDRAPVEMAEEHTDYPGGEPRPAQDG